MCFTRAFAGYSVYLRSWPIFKAGWWVCIHLIGDIYPTHLPQSCNFNQELLMLLLFLWAVFFKQLRQQWSATLHMGPRVWQDWVYAMHYKRVASSQGLPYCQSRRGLASVYVPRASFHAMQQDSTIVGAGLCVVCLGNDHYWSSSDNVITSNTANEATIDYPQITS